MRIILKSIEIYPCPGCCCLFRSGCSSTCSSQRQPRSLGKHSNSWQSMVTNPEQSTDYRIIPVHTYIPPPTYIPIRTPLLSLRPWLISGGFCFRLFFFRALVDWKLYALLSIKAVRDICTVRHKSLPLSRWYRSRLSQLVFLGYRLAIYLYGIYLYDDGPVVLSTSLTKQMCLLPRYLGTED